MKLKSGLTFSVLLSLFLIFATLNDAEARRFGGGGSFGGRSTYSSPYQRSTQPPTRSASPSQQQQAGQQAPGARSGWAKPGLTGFLGGLMMGGLLGSLFGGGGFHGANILDFLILGALVWFLFKFLAARKAGAQQRPAYAGNYERNYQAQQPDNNPGQNSASGFNTDILFGKANPGQSHDPKQDASFDSSPAPGNIPPSFDEQGFLNGAKIAYQSLQKAWDARDLAEIRGLTTDKVFAEIQQQLNSSTQENHTQVLKLNAELLDVREIGNEIEAVVMFDAIMRENLEAQAGQVQEVWHFVKPNNPNQTKWLLDGIQQLAD